MPLQTYHYAACGGLNTVVGWIVYFGSYNYLFQKQLFDLGWVAFKPHMAALVVSLLITFPLGFYLSMFVIFQGSYLKRGTQLFRYFLVLLGCGFVNYVCLKIFVEWFGWYPTPSQILTTVFVILFNYFFQRNFSFKSDKEALRKQGLEA
jgi:putative flippase GtrA